MLNDLDAQKRICRMKFTKMSSHGLNLILSPIAIFMSSKTFLQMSSCMSYIEKKKLSIHGQDRRYITKVAPSIFSCFLKFLLPIAPYSNFMPTLRGIEPPFIFSVPLTDILKNMWMLRLPQQHTNMQILRN